MVILRRDILVKLVERNNYVVRRHNVYVCVDSRTHSIPVLWCLHLEVVRCSLIETLSHHRVFEENIFTCVSLKR
jgi:hypothetical protein